MDKVFLRRSIAGLGDKNALVDVPAARSRKLVKQGFADEAVRVDDDEAQPGAGPLPPVPASSALKPELQQYVADNGITADAEATVPELQQAIKDAAEQRGVHEAATA